MHLVCVLLEGLLSAAAVLICVSSRNTSVVSNLCHQTVLPHVAAGNGFPAGAVTRAGSTQQLRSFLQTPPGTPGRPAVILTTIQKLGSLWRTAAAAGSAAAAAETLDAADCGDLTISAAQAESAGGADLASVLGSSGRVAIIADEAHRHHDSHTSEQIADILSAVFGSNTGAKQQQQLVTRKKSGLAASRVASAAAGGSSSNLQSLHHHHQQQRFVTYFGFTATPGPRALQLFGVAQPVQVDVLGQVVSVQPAAAAAAAGGANASQTSTPVVAAAAAAAAAAGPAGIQPDQQQQQLAAVPFEPHMAPATLYTPFHCYSLQQAVADGLVLDVLQRFVAVTPRFQIAGLQLSRQQQLQLQQLDAASRAMQGLGSAAGTGVQGGSAGRLKPGSARGSAGDDAGLQALMHVVGRKKARRAAAAEAAAAGRAVTEADAAMTDSNSSSGSSSSLAEGLLVQAASNSRQLVATKAEDVASRFLAAWAEAAECGFVGFRAMLVVRSRQHVVWYCQELRRLLSQRVQQVQQLLALSGVA
jgi:hypothetical protein